MKYKKKYRGIPRDTKVWVFCRDYGNNTATILEMTLENALAHEHNWDDIFFDKRFAEEKLKRFKEEE